MIFEPHAIGDLTARPCDVVVVGAGPLGLMTAMRLEAKGLDVLVLESGGEREAPETRDLARAEILTPDTHSASEINVARRVGGTSNLWGGRCLPFDPIDLEDRSWVPDARWPVSYDELRPYFAAAAAFFSIGEPDFRDPIPGLDVTNPDFSVDMLERWASRADSMDLHGEHLRRSRKIRIARNVTVTGLEMEGERVTGLKICLGATPEAQKLPVRDVVLSAGGNETVRLLLAQQRQAPHLFGGENGPLGRYYMGHVNGVIADIVLTNKALENGLGFYQDKDGFYIRRRFAASPELQRREELLNIHFWPVVPKVCDARHRSGPLSAAFLAMSIGPVGRRLVAERIRLRQIGEPPYRRFDHVLNILRDPMRFATFAPWFLYHRKFANRRLPGFFLHNKAGRYGLEFHSEQWPSANSRLTLSKDCDALGLPRLKIDYRFCEADTRSVVKAHEQFGRWLKDQDFGHLDYRCPEDAREEEVMREANHGVHQIGTARMSADPAQGVVDADCRAHGTQNLYLATTAVLPGSGQANPTFTAALLALRLADHLGAAIAKKGAPVSAGI